MDYRTIFEFGDKVAGTEYHILRTRTVKGQKFNLAKSMCCVRSVKYTTLANRQLHKLDLLTSTTMVSFRTQMVNYQAQQILSDECNVYIVH